MKSWVQISITGGSRAQGDGESRIPQLKKTPRQFQTWDAFLDFLEQLVPKGFICSANAWPRKHRGCFALAPCTRCWCPPTRPGVSVPVTYFAHTQAGPWPGVCSCAGCAWPAVVVPEVQYHKASGGMGAFWGPLDQVLTYLLPCHVCQLLRSELFQVCLLNWQWLTLIASTQGFPVIQELLGPV